MSFMEFYMFRMISKQSKIFYSIIVSYAIVVMHNLFRCKISPKMFLHCYSMSKNVALTITKRMRRIQQAYIALIVYLFTTFPIIVIFPSILISSMFSFIPRYLSFLETSRSCVIKSFISFFSQSFIPTSLSFYKRHINLQLKSLRSACLEETYKFLTLTTRLVFAIKNPFPLSNLIISNTLIMSRRF